MGEQVGNNEFRVAVVLAETNLNLCSVLAENNAVKRKRNCSPLIFLDSAVIMSLEQSKLRVLIERIGL